jgi:hypothetical protein
VTAGLSFRSKPQKPSTAIENELRLQYGPKMPVKFARGHR